VFLWVVLVIRSLKRGMSNNDSWLELNKRIEKCPSDLQKLFDDMWSRLGEDEEIYLPTAATFFNYTLTGQLRTKRYGCQYLSPWELLAATDDVIQTNFLGLGRSICAEQMINKCEEIVNKIDAHCAGLLECSRPEDERLIEPIDPASPYIGSVPYMRMRIRFVHRTAQDYLTGTAEGSRLLSHDKSTQEERLHRLLRADLVVTKIWNIASDQTGTSWIVRDCWVHLNDIQHNRRLLRSESEHELLSILWYACSVAFSKSFLSHPWNRFVPSCMFRKSPGLTTLLASCNHFDLVTKYAQFQNFGRKSSYISYIMICTVSNLLWIDSAADHLKPALQRFVRELSLLGFDANFRGVPPLDILMANLRRPIAIRKMNGQQSPKFQDNHSLYLNPQSAGTRAICTLSEGNLSSLYVKLHIIENMIELGFSLNSSDVYVLSYRSYSSSLNSDLNLVYMRPGDLIFRARASFILRLLLQRSLESHSPEGTFQDPGIKKLIERLLLRVPEINEDQEPIILAFTHPTCKNTSTRSVMYLPASSQHHVEILSWLTSELQGKTKRTNGRVQSINGVSIPDCFDSLVDSCEAVPLQHFQEQLAREGYLIPLEEYWETIPRLSDDDTETEWRQLEADAKRTKLWDPPIQHRPGSPK
jgi:hypothetical protein